MDGALRQSPYRFLFLIEKAKELAAKAQELGGQLLAAYEKGRCGVPGFRFGRGTNES